MEFYPGDRAQFNFIGNDATYKLTGTVVDIADESYGEQRVWFLSDNAFEIPKSWEIDSARTGQFITLSRHLTSLHEELPDVNVDALL